jgi:hypothetical protein
VADDLSIRRILDDVKKGQIRVPKFQRDFVWDGERVAYFMDSLYKGYPVGAVLLWRTHARLTSEKNLGPFVLPEPEKKMPVDYVLDGQQRITSIYAVFQTDHPSIKETWSQVYFDFAANEDAQESQFVVLDKAPADFSRYFPLNSLYDSTAFFKAMDGLNDPLRKRAADIYERFKESKLPVLSLETENPQSVAIVFERINRQGVALDTLQLLTAWTWSEEFDLRKSFEDLAEALEPFGYEDLGDDDNLLLRCCAALLTGEPGPEKLVAVSGAKVRERFEEVTNGIKGAIDFLRLNAGVVSIKNLPFYTVLVPLTVFFAVTGDKQIKTTHEQTTALLQWFWRCCFSRRYSSGVLRYLKEDIQEIGNLRDGTPSKLSDIPVTIEADFFFGNTFRINAVDTKTFVLMLAQLKPLSLISGGVVGLDDVLRAYNRTEFHHLYPRAALKKDKSEAEINCLANFSFLSRVDNNTIGGSSPSVYRAKLQGDIAKRLANSLCPASLFEDNYEKFINERIALIWSDRVNTAKFVGLFLSLSLLLSFPEDRASSSRSSFERRLISLIFAGRNRIIMIRRELPLTVIASQVEPVA